MAATSNEPPAMDINILGLGNPLLDLTIFECKRLIEKYNLDENNQILARPEHRNLFKELTSAPYTPVILPGGATQNSIRVAQWILGKPQATGFIGAVGEDEEGELLRKVALQCGIQVAYQVRPQERTGVCAALITGENRTLVTALEAALHFDADVTKEPKMRSLLEAAKIFYIGGYLWSSSPSNVMAAVNFASARGRIVAMNLHARFLCPFFASAEYGVLPHIDYLFGNEKEALTFAHCLAESNYPFASDFQRFKAIKEPTGDVLAEIAEQVATLPGRDGKPGRRRIIFTFGREPLVYVDGHESTPKAERVTFEAVPKEQIKDTNGCGDAFVGGFLAKISEGVSMARGIRCGLYTSRTVLQHYGCTFPEKPDYQD